MNNNNDEELPLQIRILEDQKRNTQQQLEEMLIADLDSGNPIEVTDDWWEKKRIELAQQLPQS